MSHHCNLYYLFLEDKARHPMPESVYQKIREEIKNYYKKAKPP